MGGIVSKIRFVLQLINSSLDDYDALRKRIEAHLASPNSPGPVPTQASDCSSSSSTPPYWTVPASPIAREGQTTALPVDEALLEYSKERSADAEERGENRRDKGIRVVMLEARDACSGSTGRCKWWSYWPLVYNEYGELKSAHGPPRLRKSCVRLAHISSLISTAQAEGLLSASQAREVESFDVYGHPEKFAQAKNELHEFLEEAPADLTNGFGVVEDQQGLERLQLVSSIVGCISRRGGAIHPYRFVTGILSKLLSRYPNFQLFTHTPCTTITSTSTGYVVHTPRGEVRTAHVIHATNAWSSHLLPGMRGKIIPTRTSMTAQRPGKGLSKSWAGNRAFVFYPIENTSNEAHLGGALERFFAAHWGAEAEDEDKDNNSPSDQTSDGRTGDLYEEREPKWGKGRVRAAWSGLLGMSADLQPWVGRVPYAASRRKEPAAATVDRGLAPPGEWICAGYTGEGMVHAWLSGKALARMVLDLPEKLGRSEEALRLPQPFLITAKRLREARYEDTIAGW
ncbi:FAD dependent oxidoreductase [Pholiota molesta]|nr:FAD dependent oxidoreductase [Pholiota molesta]